MAIDGPPGVKGSRIGVPCSAISPEPLFFLVLEIGCQRDRVRENPETGPITCVTTGGQDGGHQCQAKMGRKLFGGSWNSTSTGSVRESTATLTMRIWQFPAPAYRPLRRRVGSGQLRTRYSYRVKLCRTCGFFSLWQVPGETAITQQKTPRRLTSVGVANSTGVTATFLGTAP